jgi:dGTPase
VGAAPSWREARRYGGDKAGDSRTAFERDRDRILYSSAFRRLGGVTQVVWAREEGYLLHNRLTHCLKVAQVGRRLAERFERGHNIESGVSVEGLGGLDASVVEAASLAHDLGHPPFGHEAGDELDERSSSSGAKDGFEGNAQTFRVVARLGTISTDFDGLDLSRATLNAVLKYPWMADAKDALGAGRKYGVYDSDADSFEWARADGGLPVGERTLEAGIMDWADDITYAVHDVEDFYRAGLIPTQKLQKAGDEELVALAGRVKSDWEPKLGPKPTDEDIQHAAEVALAMLPNTQPFRGTAEARAALRQGTSALINRMILGTRLGRRGLEIDYPIAVEVSLLKQLTRHFVILDPALATQQLGQRQVVSELFTMYYKAALEGDSRLMPASVASPLTGAAEPGVAARRAADIVASMTEAQAVRVHRRVTGVDFGSFLDPAVF